MLTLKLLFAAMFGAAAVYWTTLSWPAPQPVLMPVEVTRIVVVTTVATICVRPLVTFANIDGSLVQCGDGRYEWRVRP